MLLQHPLTTSRSRLDKVLEEEILAQWTGLTTSRWSQRRALRFRDWKPRDAFHRVDRNAPLGGVNEGPGNPTDDESPRPLLPIGTRPRCPTGGVLGAWLQWPGFAQHDGVTSRSQRRRRGRCSALVEQGRVLSGLQFAHHEHGPQRIGLGEGLLDSLGEGRSGLTGSACTRSARRLLVGCQTRFSA